MDNGLKCIAECPNIATMMYAQVADLDVEGTYPTLEWILNISKETTRRELSNIAGITEDVKRRQGINLTGGVTNAVEICCALYKAPTFNQLLAKLQAAEQAVLA
jgi:hydrogenase maturation factor